MKLIDANNLLKADRKVLSCLVTGCGKVLSLLPKVANSVNRAYERRLILHYSCIIIFSAFA